MDWVCRSSNGGTWTASIDDKPGFGGFGGLLLLVLLWSLVPFGIAVWLASARGESVGSAVLLTLVLGWVGLAIVYFGQGKTRETVEGLAQRIVPPRQERSPTDLRLDSPDGRDVSEAVDGETRLRRLGRLRAENLLTDEEFKEQRQRIIDSL